MVAPKKKRIAKKPSTPPPAAEAWIQEGGTDPENTTPAPPPLPAEPEPLPTSAMEVETEADQGKPYPHRISFDMSTAQYKRLKWASFDSSRTMNEILREAIEDWMKAREY